MSKSRLFIFRIVMAVMLAAIAWKLFDLQIVKGDRYLEAATERLTTNITEKAHRGEIYDRYGEPLVTNKVGYSVVVQQAGQTNAELNKVIKRLIDILYSENCAYNDTLPITFAPYTFVFDDEDGDGNTQNELNKWFAENQYLGKKINEGMSAEEVFNIYKEL